MNHPSLGPFQGGGSGEEDIIIIVSTIITTHSLTHSRHSPECIARKSQARFMLLNRLSMLFLSLYKRNALPLLLGNILLLP